MADSSAFPKPGDTIAAKYLIERTIGTGGMSVVFGATHRVTGKRFAIKWLLRDDSTPSTEAAARFIREAQVAGRFQHPNVVEVYDVGEVSGSFYMVMDWLEGESLATRLERTGRLPLEDACRYLIPCMLGMDEAHSAGIVHRDLKPANIFICQPTKHSPERAKVLDFGVAKLTDPNSQLASSIVTKAGMLIGTPYYLSPEQLRGQVVDARTDIYAFGVILYQVLSGQLPFPATTFGELVVQIAAASPIALRHLVPTLPVGVDELVSRAMMRDPAQRYQDLRALAAAFERFSSEGSTRSGYRHREELVIVSESRPSIPLAAPLIDSSLTPPPTVSDIEEPSASKRSAWLLVTLLVLIVPALLLARRFSSPEPTVLRPEFLESADATATGPALRGSDAQSSQAAATGGPVEWQTAPANDPQFAASRTLTEPVPSGRDIGLGPASKRAAPGEPSAAARVPGPDAVAGPGSAAGASVTFGLGGSIQQTDPSRRAAARSTEGSVDHPAHRPSDARPTPAPLAAPRASASSPAPEPTMKHATAVHADAATPSEPVPSPASAERNPLDMQLQ
jgi:serine/threonine protein kinase